MMYWLQQLQQKRWEHDKLNHLLEGDLPTSDPQPDTPPAFKTEGMSNDITLACFKAQLKHIFHPQHLMSW